MSKTIQPEPRKLNKTEEEMCRIILEKMAKEYKKPLKNDRSDYEKGY
jgi:hypothetical protein